MRWLAGLVVSGAMAWAGDTRSNSVPEWTINLMERFGWQAFDRTVRYPWSLHQGVVFLSPERVLVYQVNRSSAPARLAPRDASGGSGNFILEIRILRASDGRELKTLHMTTNAASSEVLATRAGRFLVRTGEVLYLYSAEYERLAARDLALLRQTQEEAWQVGVSPSGARIALAHQQIFKRNQLSRTSDVEKASTDVEILNEADLGLTDKFTLPWTLDESWSAAEEGIICAQPSSSGDPWTPGLLDFHGRWSPLTAAAAAQKSCYSKVTAMDEQRFAVYGCGHISVAPASGKAVFQAAVEAKEHIGSVKSQGNELAFEVERQLVKTDNSGNIPIRTWKPLRVEMRDIASGRVLLFSPVRAERAYYAIAQGGALAVVDGSALAVYRARP